MDAATLQLIESAAVEQVLIQYASACDERNWPALDAVFAADLTANYGGEFKLEGRENVVNMIRSMLDGCGPTQHLLGNFRISVDEQKATCQCYVRAIHAGTNDSKDTLYEVWAQYRDTLRKTPEGWRITSRQMIINNEVGSREILRPGK